MSSVAEKMSRLPLLLKSSPWFVGFVSDELAPQYGDESLRWALVSIVTVGNLWAAIHYFIAARSLRADLLLKERLPTDDNSL